MMVIQWNKSLYGTINAATQALVDELNDTCMSQFPKEYEDEWGNKTTAREKYDYLVVLQKQREEDKLNLNYATDPEIERAREEYANGSDDNIEIEENATASRGEDGVWVAAWVWLPNN
jgi:hypothetical protein